MVDGKLRYYPTTTREESPKMGRITDLLSSARCSTDLGIPPISPETDRAMVCGNLAFNVDIKEDPRRLWPARRRQFEPKEYVVEKAFLD